MTAPATDVVTSVLARGSRRGPLELLREGVQEIIARQRLIRHMVRANLKRTHADTVLGQLWWILDPLFLMAVYFVLVSVVFKRATPDYPLFLFAAILPWKWFSTSLSSASVSVTGRDALIKQVQFPKLVLPVAAVGAEALSFAFGLIALAFMYLFFIHRLTPWVFAIPLIAAVQLVFSLALAIVLAAVNAFYRDVQNVLGHVLRLWFYMSPALYALDHVAKSGPVRDLLGLNPMAPILESYRAVIWGTDTTGGVAPDFIGLASVLLFSGFLVCVAVILFKRVEPAFARII